jgi:hypothetical protein
VIPRKVNFTDDIENETKGALMMLETGIELDNANCRALKLHKIIQLTPLRPSTKRAISENRIKVEWLIKSTKGLEQSQARNVSHGAVFCAKSSRSQDQVEVLSLVGVTPEVRASRVTTSCEQQETRSELDDSKFPRLCLKSLRRIAKPVPSSANV